MRFYFRYRIRLDLIISVTGAICVWMPPKGLDIFQRISFSSLEAFSLTILNTSASLLGFVLAASTFLISHIQHPRFSVVRKAVSYIQLPRLIASSLWRLLSLTVASGLLVFVNPNIASTALAVVVGLIIWAFMALWATLWIVIRIYSIPLDQPRQ